MLNIHSLPTEILTHIYELSVTEKRGSSSLFANQAHTLARGLLPLVNRAFANIDQRFILNKHKETTFEHTKNAIINFAKKCRQDDSGNQNFKSHVAKLLAKNNCIEVDFSTMSENQETLFLEVFDAAVKSKSATIINLKITAATNLPDLKQLTQLESLLITKCDGYYELPSLDQLTKLKNLTITCCNELKSIPSLDKLTALDSLNIHLYEQQASIPSLDKLTVLKSLEINDYRKVPSHPPSLDKLTALESLKISNCEYWTSLPSLNNLVRLKLLMIAYCHELTVIPSLNRLTSLNTLQILDCDELRSIPELNQLTALTSVGITNCDSLNSLPSLDKLSSLETAYHNLDPHNLTTEPVGWEWIQL